MVSREEYPFIKRISHGINLINFIALGITGYLIHAPYAGMPLNLMRNLHFFFMYFLIINGLVRLYYAFFGKKKDYKEFVFGKDDIKNFLPQLKYYLFVGKHPKTGKYNPLQKLAYLSLPFFTLIQIITGFILYRPMESMKVAEFFGGLAAVRGIHYVTMWLFFAIIMAHIYLVFTESREHFWIMFFGKHREERRAITKLETQPTTSVLSKKCG